MVMMFRPGQRLYVPGVQVYSGRAAAVGGDSAVLDGISGVIAAYSASRQLLSSYGGSYLQDVSGACATWYDQSGNGRNATESTSGNRPLTNGTLGGRTALNFDGTNDGLTTSAFALSGPNVTALIALHLDTVSKQQNILRARPNGALGAADGVSAEIDIVGKYGGNTFVDGGGNAIGMNSVGEGTPTTSAIILSVVWSH